MFNGSPKLALPDVLLFGDAHAGEQYVVGDYSLITGVRLDGRGSSHGPSWPSGVLCRSIDRMTGCGALSGYFAGRATSAASGPAR